MGPLIPALLALLLSAPPARAQRLAEPNDFAYAEPYLFQELDPHYAADFLKDAAAQRANAAVDADREARLVERATALKDMSDIMISYVDPAAMNEALRLRLGDDDANPDPDAPKLLGFGAHPDKLLAWRAKYFDFVPAAGLEQALWEWQTLSPDQTKWLSAPPRSLTREKWEAASFPRRYVSLHEWAGAIYDKMMKASPKTPGELAQMQNQRFAIWAVMDGSQKRLSGEYITKAAAAVQGLQRLESLPKSVRESRDPAIKDLLAKARSGATPLDTLAALGRLFDAAGVRDDAVQTQAPDRPDQKLSSVDPKLFGSMLGTALLTEVGDVDAGRAVAKFFQNHPLSVKARDLSTNLAQFEPNTGDLVFNERFIGDWIKGQGLSAQAVISDPPRLQELAMILAPNFVHESTHQMQKAYADEHGIFAWNAQHQEIEAKEVQSDYMLEKMAKDAAYRQFLTRARGTSFIVQQDLAQTAAFQRDPRSFHAVVMSDYYAGLPSLEATESATLLYLDTSIGVLRDEKSRRAALPAAERAALESVGKDRDEDFKTTAEWRVYLKTVKSSVLDTLIKNDAADRDKTLKTYELMSARQTAVLDHIESDAESVIRGDAPPPAHDVPPPGKRP